MAGISGLGSGIDIDSIVSAMVNAEKAPKTNQLDRLESQTVTKISAIGTLTGALNTFKSTLDSLNKISLFEARTASSSNSSAVKVTADATAPAGSYSVQVQQLASSSKVALQSITDAANAKFSTGQLEISAGDTSLTVNVTEANNTLSGLRDAINAEGKDKGISATIITDDSGSRLVLNSTHTGGGADVNVNVTEDGEVAGAVSLLTQQFTPQVDPDDPDAFIKPDSTSGAGGVISVAKSAKLSIDGLQLERKSNTITDALEGVTLDLVSVQSAADIADGKAITVTLGADKSSVKTNLQKFVDAYNALMTTASSLTAVAEVQGSTTPAVGPLVGDSTVRNLLAGLRSELVEMTAGTGIKALADLGVTTGKDGKLNLDDAQLTKALNDNYEQVGGFLTGENGLIGRLSSSVSSYLGDDGVLRKRTDALHETKNNVDKQRETLRLRIESLQTRLYAQYNAMDSLVGQLSRTSESLAGMLASLPGFTKKD